MSRPPSPTSENLWSDILNSVSSTRGTPSKNVLILGEPSTGKTSLCSAFLQQKAGTTTSHGRTRAESEVDKTASGREWSNREDFALGYQWADIRDEADDETLARLSIYTIPSSSPSHLALLPHFLPPKTSLPHTLIIIVLDWTKPWTFIEHLHLWLSWIDQWAKGDGGREIEIVREECREKLQFHLQHYTEPAASSQAPDPILTSASTLNSTVLPLGLGTLTHNPAGVPIIIACTKSDLIDEEEDVGIGMVKGKGGEWEERTDGIMQVLRTMSLKYGAALFYTTPQPTTLALLRLYTLHLLFSPPPPSPNLTSEPAPFKNPFLFPHRPNTLDRDRILVPAGWDSWGKIGVLRDGFDAARWGDAWEKDLDDEGPSPGGARDLFRALVGGDQGDKPKPLPPVILPEPEQSFLQKAHETLSKDPSRDPRQTFRQPPPATLPSASADYAVGAGVVGPMGSSSFSLPSVEKAMMEFEGESVDVGARLMGLRAGPPAAAAAAAASASPNTGRRENGRVSVNTAVNSNPTRPVPASLHPTNNNHPSSNSIPSPVSPGGTHITPSPDSVANPRPSQHEVLQKFFDSLLTARGAGAGANAAGTTPERTTNGTGAQPHSDS